MILALDAYYNAHSAHTVGLAFAQWTDSVPVEIFSLVTDTVEAYEPGAFYKRELPGILALLRKIESTHLTYLVVDGFVVLDDSGKPGLGAHLYAALENRIPVIGVAKSGFFGNHKFVKPLVRGAGKRPLYITAMGVPLEEAYEMIRSMHGNYRVPTLLQILDRKTKEGLRNRPDALK